MMNNMSMTAEELRAKCQENTMFKEDRTTDIILGLVCLVFSILASIGNLASLIYVKLNWSVGNKRRGNYTHQMTMILVVNIAITDMFNGVFSASFNAANLLREEYPVPAPMVMTALCNFCGLVHFLTTRAGIFLMCVFSIFRYIAITKPILFSNHCCKTVLLAVLVVVWAIVIAMSGLPYYFNTEYIYFPEVSHCWFHFWQLRDGLTDFCDFLVGGAGTLDTFSFFGIVMLPIHVPGFTMIVFTLLILARLGKLHYKLKQGKGPRRSSEDSLHAKAAYSTLMILVFFVVTYAPWWIISLIHYFDMIGLVPSSCPKTQFWRCKLKSYFGYTLMISMNVLIYMNAAINPFIYYYRLFKRSEAMKKALYTRATSMNGKAMSRVSQSQGRISTSPLNHLLVEDPELEKSNNWEPEKSMNCHVSTV